MKKTIFAALGLICSSVFVQAQAPSGEAVLVTPDNFNRAETDMNFAGGGGREIGRFSHHREPISIDFPIVRPNRDTPYSLSVFDLDAGPVTITLPNAGQRFMSLQVIDEDHYTPEVVYGVAATPSPGRRSAPAMSRLESASWSTRPIRRT